MSRMLGVIKVLSCMLLDANVKSFQVQNGVKLGEGDGTVSLLSLGAMCVEGWKYKRWNPAGIQVTTVEVCYDKPVASLSTLSL